MYLNSRFLGKWTIQFTLLDKIYCSPYKYDILIRVPTQTFQRCTLNFGYLDAETGQEIKENIKGKPAVDLGRSKVVDENGMTEVSYRVCFTVCSFHHFRRPFIFTASLVPNDSDQGLKPILFFHSKAFLTFARKNTKEDETAWISDDEEIEEEEEEFLGKRPFEVCETRRKRARSEDLSKEVQDYRNQSESDDTFETLEHLAGHNNF